MAHPQCCGRWARVSDHGALQLRGLAYRPRGLARPGVVAYQHSAGGRYSGTCRLVVSRLAGTAPAQACATGGHVCSAQQGWLVHSERCLQVHGVLTRRYCARTGMCCRRPCLVHPARGPCMVCQQGDRCSSVPGSGWRRGLDLVPGLSWTRGMLLYARLSGLMLGDGLMLGNVPGHMLGNGLMLGNVPGHVLSHVCGHVRSMCPVLGVQYSNTDRNVVYM